jgi:hypothetical protein
LSHSGSEPHIIVAAIAAVKNRLPHDSGEAAIVKSQMDGRSGLHETTHHETRRSWTIA